MCKTVYLPIRVPDNEYCWDGLICCEYFDNECGYGQCNLDLGILEKTKDYIYKKPKECLKLVTIVSKKR